MNDNMEVCRLIRWWRPQHIAEPGALLVGAALLAAGIGACGLSTGLEGFLPSDVAVVSAHWDDVEQIISNTSITEEVKRQRLNELGITDEALIDALIRASSQ